VHVRSMALAEKEVKRREQAAADAAAKEVTTEE
jgi:hypothetical protein